MEEKKKEINTLSEEELEQVTGGFPGLVAPAEAIFDRSEETNLVNDNFKDTPGAAVRKHPQLGKAK